VPESDDVFTAERAQVFAQLFAQRFVAVRIGDEDLQRFEFAFGFLDLLLLDPVDVGLQRP